MKKVFFAGVITLMMMIGCRQDEKKEDTASDRTAEMKTLYEKNLSTLKTVFSDFEKEDIDGQAALIADGVKWNSPAYGDTVHTKSHWIESLKYYVDNWSDIHFANGQFLPGLDSATHEFDGSVRCYGQWDGKHTSGVATSVYYYGTFDFDKENKIIAASEFFDVGGLMNAVSKK